MSSRKKALPRNTSVAPKATRDQWQSYVIRHVKIHSLAVSKTLWGRDMEEARELILDYLDGFLVWLRNPAFVEAFKQSFYVSTTYIVRGDTESHQDIESNEKTENRDDANHPENVDKAEDAGDDGDEWAKPNRKRRHDIRSYRLSTVRPTSKLEARQNLEAYLVLWRSIYTICETAAHAPNRLAQIFDWEVSHIGPLFTLSRLLAYPKNPFSEDGYLSNVDYATPQLVGHDVFIAESDIDDFYQDGLKEIEGRKFNFDDLNECATFRIKASNCNAPPDDAYLPRLKPGWIHKTFKEPEGVWAYIISFRSYYPILMYNYYLTLGAWAWYERGDLDIKWILLADGVVASIGFFLEAISKWKVFSVRSYFIDNLPAWALLFNMLLYIVALGEIGLWVLVTRFKFLPQNLANWVVIMALAGAVVLRLLNNTFYFFYFPTLRKGHHKYRTSSKGSQFRLFVRSVIFFTVITGVLVPLYYWFVVPTLKRSAPWTFCPAGAQLSTKIQCYVGVIGLWIPLISIILIMDFIAYVIVMSFYGLSLATARHVGGTNEAAHSMMSGFRSFSILLRKWTNPKPGQSRNLPGIPSLTSSMSLLTDSSPLVGRQVAASQDSSISPSSSADPMDPHSPTKANSRKKKIAMEVIDDSPGASERSVAADDPSSSATPTSDSSPDPTVADNTAEQQPQKKKKGRGLFGIRLRKTSNDTAASDPSDSRDDPNSVEMASQGTKSRRRSAKKQKKRPESNGPIVLNREEEYMYRVKIRMNPLAELAEVEHEMEAMRTLWYLIVDDLMNMDMISNESAKSLYVALNYQDIPLGSKPKDIISFFFSSLYAMTADHEWDKLPPNYLEKMPSLTQLIPSYGESVVFETGYLCNRENKKVTNLEFLVLKYPKQWEYFYDRMKIAFGHGSHVCYGTANPGHSHARRRDPMHGSEKYRFPQSAEEMMLWFLKLGTCNDVRMTALHPDLVDEIRLWASLRGQTLYKTLRGSLSYRMALRAMYACTKHGQEHVHTKTQVVLAHQQYGDPSMLRQIAGDILLVYKQLSVPNIIGPLFGDTPFDLVFDWSPRDLQVQHAFREKLGSEKNEEYIRRYTLNNIFTETEDICAHGEALRRLIDAKAGDCPISPTEGFPFASVIAGLPTPTRIYGRAWLFKYKGNGNQAFGEGGGGMRGGFPQSADFDEYEDAGPNGMVGGDDGFDDNDEDAPSSSPGSAWQYMAYGQSVVHNSTRTEAVNDALAWLRCFNDHTGREFDFVIHRGTFELISLSYFTIPSALSATKHHQSHDMDSDDAPSDRVYAAIKFGVRHAWVPNRFEVFSIVTCLNEDQFSRFLSDIPQSHSNHSAHESSMITEVESQRDAERHAILAALSHSQGFKTQCHSDSFTATGKGSYRSCLKFHDVLQSASTPHAMQKSGNQTYTDVFLGIEVRTLMPRRRPLILRVAPELPFGDADRIQGKSANQVNGLRFGFGLVLQTKDANQGGNVAECLKLPISLRNFLVHNARDRRDQQHHLKHWFKKYDKHSPDFETWQSTPTYVEPVSHNVPVELMDRSIPMEDEYERDNKRLVVPPAIQGFREAIFTKSQGAVARFQSYSEWTFGTLVQRVSSKLNIRMHYGHPDFFSSAWVYSRLLSKANPVYNLSEDIFAGYFTYLHGRTSSHTDKIQDEKGRDTSLASTAIFTAKLAQGAASQMKSRDVFHLNTRLDFIRLFLIFHSSLGYYFTTTTMLLSVRAYLFAFIVFSLAGYSAENLQNLSFVYSMPFLVQVGMATLIPLILETGIEEGVLAVLKLICDLPLSLGFYLFQGQTTAHHMVESFQKGKSHYEATGRLLGISRKSLVDIYQLFGASHIEPAMDYLFYIIAYYIIASSRHGGYMPLFAPIICVLVFFIAPSGFQVASSIGGIFTDVGAFGRWILRTESFASLLKEWKSTPMREQMIKNLTWKATFQTKHTRLQTYSIFRSLKSAITTHWRVDMAASIFNWVRVCLWGFIIISVPGGLKDSILKIVLALALYILLAMAISTIAPHDKKGCWYSVSVVLFVIGVVYFISMFIMLNVWRYLGDSIVGIFVALKLLKALSWALFHMYAVVKKVVAANRWRFIDWNLRRGKLELADRDKATRALKSDLEKNLLAGLFLVDSVDRPVMIFFLSVAFIPIHIVWNVIWAIPYLSHYLMYSVRLIPKKGYNEIMRPAFGPWNMGSGFNVTVDQVNDLDELPAFNFEGDADFYF